MDKKFFAIFPLIFVLTAIPLAGLALVFKTGENIVIAQNVEGNFFGAGNLVIIEGTVNGDVFAAGNSISIKGTVEGDVFAAGSNIDVSGTIKGSLRAAASDINIQGRVEHNILAGSANLIIDQAAFVGGHITYAGAGLVLQGPVGGQIDAASQSIVLNNSVGGDVNLYLRDKDSHLSVLEKAVLSRNLNYKALSEAEIKDGAQILGETNFTRLEPRKTDRERGAWALKKFALGMSIFGFVNLFLLGLILIYLVPKIIDRVFVALKEKPWSNLGIGLMGIIVIPVLSILLLFTIVGIPFALMVMALFLISIYFTKAMAAMALGRLISERFNWQWHKILSLLLGLVIFTLIGLVPFVGWLAVFLLVLWAFGGLLRVKSQILKEWR